MGRNLEIDTINKEKTQLLLFIRVSAPIWKYIMDTHRGIGDEYQLFFTKLLRLAMVILRKTMSNQKLYAEEPKAANSYTKATHNLELAGHLYRHPEEASYNLMVLSPYHYKRKN